MTDLDTLLAEIDAAPKSGPVYDNITAEEAAKRYSNHALATFHYFNDNGIRAEWSELGSRLLAFGRGYLAYGDTGYYNERLYALARYERKRVNPNELWAIVSGIRKTIERGNAFLAENNA
jgi:hypothetical protein